MKYIIFDDCGNDIFTSEFETKEEAIKKADLEWGKLSEHDKKRKNAFYVLESVNPDYEAPDHFDGFVVKNYK